MKSDIEISRSARLKPISEIAAELKIPSEKVKPFGHYKAKLPLDLIDEDKVKQSNMILVTAMTPTKAGIGKTTTSVGLTLGLNKIGKKSIVALREPSLGPCFGMKGGAAGGGYAQVLPMEEINLHFTGDFHAITSAHNTITALLDNYQFQNQGTDKQLKEIVWKRVLDVNDRSLRFVVSGLGGNTNGVASETGFDITPASEIMAVFCLSKDYNDLRKRIDSIILGYTANREPFRVKDLKIGGAIVVLLKEALEPNLVQTTENTPAIIHGGPFANIAHGCNSLIATKMAMSLSDYVITEAGFGADLGAEKFLNIKCRMGGIYPKATVMVVTSQALKLHGEVDEKEIKKPNLEGIKKGLRNLEKHLDNLKRLGQKVVISFNQYYFDSDEELNYMRKWAEEKGHILAINYSFVEGGEGAVELAEKVVALIEKDPSKGVEFSYKNEEPIQEKLNAIVQKVYGGKKAVLSKKAFLNSKRIARLGLEHFPVCIAKTQYSFTDDPKNPGHDGNFEIEIRELIINEGAGFIVAVAGDIMRMPGLPKEPQALHIDMVDGQIEGLS